MEQRGLMAVHAHPDDEVISTGGVLAAAAERGLPTTVVTCTGGERGEIVGEGMDPEEIRPRLAEVRRAELSAALDLLGAGPPVLLGYVDSGMMGTDGNADPQAFWNAPFDEAVARLVTHIRAARPSVLVTYDAFGGYGHPDHIQAHRVALVASEAAAVAALYPDAGPAWRIPKVYLATIPKSAILAGSQALTAAGLPSPFGTPERLADVTMGCADADLGAVVDVRPWLDRKWAALRAHRSQIGPESFFLNVPDTLRDEMFGTEWFIRYRSDVASNGVEHDLFAGLA